MAETFTPVIVFDEIDGPCRTAHTPEELAKMIGGTFTNQHPPAITMADILAAAVELERLGPPPPRGYMVAPDVIEALRVHESPILGQMPATCVRVEPLLPSGFCIPLDCEGRPMVRR